MSEESPLFRQFARMSPWNGINVSHNRVGAIEMNGSLSSEICVTLMKTPLCVEYRRDNGRWVAADSPTDSIVITPCGWHSTVRWLEHEQESFNVVIDLDWLSGNPQGAGVRLSSFNVPDRLVAGIRDRLLGDMIRELYRDNQCGASTGLAYGETLAVSILCRLSVIDCGIEKSFSKSGRNKMSLDKALDYIDENLNSELTIGGIIKSVNFDGSIGSFIRQFQNLTGQTPHSYILDKRLSVALDLIVAGKMNLTSIALEVGFSSLSHFSVAFHKRYGVPPSRRALR